MSTVTSIEIGTKDQRGRHIICRNLESDLRKYKNKDYADQIMQKALSIRKNDLSFNWLGTWNGRLSGIPNTLNLNTLISPKEQVDEQNKIRCSVDLTQIFKNCSLAYGSREVADGTLIDLTILNKLDQSQLSPGK